jgi:hypothetical protein
MMFKSVVQVVIRAIAWAVTNISEANFSRPSVKNCSSQAPLHGTSLI